MRANKSEVVVVLDRSGSMSSIKDDMEGGFETFINKQKKEPGECLITLYQFDDVFETVYECRDIKQVNAIILQPRNGTALHDAVAKAIDQTGKRLAETPESERPETVIFMVITDGGENASKEFNALDVKERTIHQTQKYNWKFLYIGANQDAAKVGSTIGLAACNTLSYSASPRGVLNTWGIASSGISCMRSDPNSVAAYSFSDQQRASAMEK